MSNSNTFLRWVRSSLLGHIALSLLFSPALFLALTYISYEGGALSFGHFFYIAALSISCCGVIGLSLWFTFTLPLAKRRRIGVDRSRQV